MALLRPGCVGLSTAQVTHVSVAFDSASSRLRFYGSTLKLTCAFLDCSLRAREECSAAISTQTAIRRNYPPPKKNSHLEQLHLIRLQANRLPPESRMSIEPDGFWGTHFDGKCGKSFALTPPIPNQTSVQRSPRGEQLCRCSEKMSLEACLFGFRKPLRGLRTHYAVEGPAGCGAGTSSPGRRPRTATGCDSFSNPEGTQSALTVKLRLVG
jgi:hypothetical protein